MKKFLIFAKHRISRDNVLGYSPFYTDKKDPEPYKINIVLEKGSDILISYEEKWHQESGLDYFDDFVMRGHA